jgi:hypothetical protein
LAHSNHFAHLFFGEPAALADQLAFHLAHERYWSAKAQGSKAQEIARKIPDRVRRVGCLH